MYSKNAAVLLFGDFPHHLDHLAPLSIELNIPLIITDDNIEKQAVANYPKLNCQKWSFFNLSTQLPQTFDAVISCISGFVLRAAFAPLPFAFKKPLELIWCPHGNSDKGISISHYFKALGTESAIMVYGEKMIDFIKESNVFEQIESHYIIGNYRYYHYLKNFSFYHEIQKEKILPFIDPKNRTILYAPTWNDQEDSSSFCSACKIILENLPEKYNLICKLHPNLNKQAPDEVASLLNTFQKKKNILFLFDFPLIYPILSLCDIYLGDFSSIGYDFLTFEKPMYFLNEKKRKNIPLFKCGVKIKPEEYPKIYSIIDKTLGHHPTKYLSEQKNLYTYTFGPKTSPLEFFENWDKLKIKLLNTVLC